MKEKLRELGRMAALVVVLWLLVAAVAAGVAASGRAQKDCPHNHYCPVVLDCAGGTPNHSPGG